MPIYITQPLENKMLKEAMYYHSIPPVNKAVEEAKSNHTNSCKEDDKKKVCFTMQPQFEFYFLQSIERTLFCDLFA